MQKTERLHVFYNRRKVGTMAVYKNVLAAFEYDKEWLAEGFSISPFSLPLQQKVFIPKADPFDGVFGVFADTLPDGWGRLLVDRMLLRNNIDPGSIGQLDRLAIVGDSGMGALTYKPEIRFEKKEVFSDLDCIAEECATMLQTNQSENLDEFFRRRASQNPDKNEWGRLDRKIPLRQRCWKHWASGI